MSAAFELTPAPTAVGIPSFVIVELEEPLGDRVVRDGFGAVQMGP